MADIVTPIASGDTKASVKTKIVTIVERWLGAGAASGGNTPTTWGAARTLLNSVAALVTLTAIGATDVGATARARINALNDDTAGGRKTASSLDILFDQNKVYGAPSMASVLACSRASTAYADNTAGEWTSFGNNVARLTDKGLLIEESRTNQTRNNVGGGATIGVIGSGGVVPTNWSVGSGAGTTSREIVGVGVENGVDYVDIRYVGTGTGAFEILCDTSAPAAASGQSWTGSIFVKLAAGSLANCSVGTVIYELPSVVNTSINIVSSINSTLKRFTVTRTLNQGTTTTTSFRLNINCTTAYDFTIRVGWHQFEQGAFVTSPIRTTSAAVTRAADVCTGIAPATFANLTEGTLHAEWFDPVGPAAIDRRAAGLGVNSSDNIRIIASTTGNKVSGIVTQATVAQATFASANNVVAGTTYKSAVRWKANDFGMRWTASLGSAPADDVSGNVPDTGSLVLTFGTSVGTANYLNGYLKRVTLFQVAQNNAALDALVA